MFFTSIYCLLNDQKYAQKVWSKDLVYKKPFGYRVIHQNSLTSCPGRIKSLSAKKSVMLKSTYVFYFYNYFCTILVVLHSDCGINFNNAFQRSVL